jgi:hypothetical protein
MRCHPARDEPNPSLRQDYELRRAELQRCCFGPLSPPDQAGLVRVAGGGTATCERKLLVLE